MWAAAIVHDERIANSGAASRESVRCASSATACSLARRRRGRRRRIARGARAPSLAVVCRAVLVGAGVWAQLVEGSPALLRPFGYYGGVVGGHWPLIAWRSAPISG